MLVRPTSPERHIRPRSARLTQPPPNPVISGHEISQTFAAAVLGKLPSPEPSKPKNKQTLWTGTQSSKVLSQNLDKDNNPPEQKPKLAEKKTMKTLSRG